MNLRAYRYSMAWILSSEQVSNMIFSLTVSKPVQNILLLNVLFKYAKSPLSFFFAVISGCHVIPHFSIKRKFPLAKRPLMSITPLTITLVSYVFMGQQFFEAPRYIEDFFFF